MYNVGKGTYWYGADHDLDAGSDTRYTGHTSSLYDATPARVRISGGNYTFTYYVNGVEYQLRHTTNNGNSILTGGSADFQLWSKTDGYTIEFKTDYQRRLHAEDAGTCDYDRKLGADNNTLHWRFYAYEEILPDLVEHNVSTCASTAASIVSGWERVTTKEQLAQNPERYFYAIFSAVNPGVMMTTEYKNDAYRMCYKAAGNPLSSSSYDLFEMENYDGEFAIKSNITGKYYGNTSEAPWNFIADQEALNEDCKVTVTCSNGVYNLQDKYAKGQDEFVGNYLGAWDNMEFVGERLAGNKGQSRAGYFLIYRKLKKDLDMTSRITNPSFEAENISAWSCTTGSDTGRKENSGNYFMSNVAGSYLFNTWNNGNASEVSQTLSNMPSGFYTLSAVMASDNNETLRLKVGNDVIATSTAAGAGNGIETSGSFSFSGGNMVIKADANNHWYKADNFRLTYLGGMEDLTPVIGKMNADVNTAQQNAIDTYNSNKTVANYIAAQEAITNAEASIAAYANAASYLEKVELLLATTNFYTTAAYDNVYDNYKTAYENYTLDDATAAGLSYKTPSYTPAEARYTDNTANDLLIPGWTIGGNDATKNPGFYINTWSSEDDGNGFAKPFFEYWTSESSLSGTTLVGTKTGLTPNKLYRVTANVRIQGTANSGKIKMQVGTGDEIDVTKGNRIGETSRYMKEYIAVGKTDAYGNLTLKFTVESESNISWLSFRDVMYAEQDDDFTYIIKQADCNTTSQEYWPGNGRTTATGEHYSGDENRVYFTFTSGEDRHQDVTFPATGKYLLKTAVRCKVANTIATMSVGTASATTNFASSKNCYVIGTDGNETTTVNSDGGNWVYNELYFDANAGDVKTITIQLTSKDNVGETDCGGMTLTYLGTEGTLVGMEVSAVAKAGTFVAPFDVVIPARTTAYTVKAAGNGYITLEEKAVAGETLAANTPVILYAEDGIASKISKQFYGTATGSENENGDGYLIGMYNSVDIIERSAQNYVMQYNSTAGKPEFRQVTSEGFTTTANRSYLKLNANSESRVVIKFDGEDPTAITAIEAAESESGLKDGKYIIDNKVVIVKNGVKYSANGQKLN